MRNTKVEYQIEVMQAYLDDKPIEFRRRTGDSKWEDVLCVHEFDWASNDYRISLKPRIELKSIKTKDQAEEFMSGVPGVIKRLISNKVDTDIEEITDNVKIGEICDSLDAVEICMDIETKYDIKLNEYDGECGYTIGDLIKAVENKIKAKWQDSLK